MAKFPNDTVTGCLGVASTKPESKICKHKVVELSSIRSDCCMFYVVSMQTGEWTILVYNLLVFLIILTFAGEDIL